MKLIKRHQFGGILGLLKKIMTPMPPYDSRPENPPPSKKWPKLPLMEVDRPVDNKTYNGGTLPGITVSAINLAKPQPFPYGEIKVENNPSLAYMTGNNPLQEAVYRNKASKMQRGKVYKKGGLIKKHQSGTTKGGIQPSDNTRVQKPIPGIIDPSSKVRSYDNFPFRVSENYPYNDHYQLEAPARKYNSPFGGEMNVKYPYIYGIEVTSLGPEYIQKISGKDTTYFTRGDDNKFYEIVGSEVRPRFREAFKNPKETVTPPNYFNTPEKIERVKKVISNWNK